MNDPEADDTLTLAARQLAAQGAEMLAHLPEDELPENIYLKTDSQGNLMVATNEAVYVLREGAVWRRSLADNGRSVTVFKNRAVIGTATMPRFGAMVGSPELN